MDIRHRAGAEGAPFRAAAYCAPAPSRAKRGRQEANLAAAERPWRAPGRDVGTRADAAATEKKLRVTYTEN